MEILNLTLDQVTRIFEKEFGKGLYHAAALYREIFKHGNTRFLSAAEFVSSPRLLKQLEGRVSLTPGQVVDTFQEGNLTKFITRLNDGLKIESVVIPMTNHQTLCISSQVGCRMGCRFCETGKMGLKRNLAAHEIIGQLFNARFVLGKNIKNVVFMGMGEPLDNFDNVLQAIRVMSQQKGLNIVPRHMTVSTAGLSNGIEKLGRLRMTGLRLAVSVNAADDPTRTFLMPVNRSHPLETLKKSLERYPLPRRGCFLFEYILIKGLNDSLNDAINLAEYIKPLPVRLNLISYNPVEGFDYKSPDDEDMHRFANLLSDQGVFVVKRWSKGRSVAAGCGQLGKTAAGGKAVCHDRGRNP